MIFSHWEKIYFTEVYMKPILNGPTLLIIDSSLLSLVIVDRGIDDEAVETKVITKLFKLMLKQTPVCLSCSEKGNC